jgi:DNA invertase Pin-like site-specific DNA recombinase
MSFCIFSFSLPEEVLLLFASSFYTALALAKKGGVYKGRKPSLTAEQVKEIRRRVGAGERKTALAREFKISRQTLYSALPM